MNRIILILILLFLLPAPAHAVLSIDITRGQVNPLPIALLDFAGPDTETNALGADVAGVISADLESSGLFAPIDPRAFIQSRLSANTMPRFADWRQINAQALVSGTVTPDSSGKVRIEFRLWDVLSEQQFAGKSFVTSPQNWRRVAHMIADAIYTRLSGEDGYFDSRIVYISEVQRGKVKIKRLAIMDQDGANHQFLTRGRELVLTPRFDPTSQQIIYLSYRNQVPSVHLYNLETGREELIGNFKGMSFAPRFSPDGKKAIMSVSLDGNSEIFELDLATRKTRRLTRNPAIDTSPSYAPDGKQIVFNSNRGGSQQLYVMNRNGDNVRRISFGKGTYGTPVWSPRGDFIAFTKMHKGKFHIGVMRPSGKGERLLTESFLDEGPTWAPNGRVIMFFRQERGRKNRQGIVRLYSIDLTGYNEREIKTPEEASDPAWSPLLSTR